MLAGFKLKNFRSFCNEQTYTYLPTSDRAHLSTQTVQTESKTMPRLCTIGIVLGPNASGKSNLLMALKTLQYFVLRSTMLSTAQFAEQYTPFLYRQNGNEPISLEIDLVLSGVRYRYGIAFDNTRIRAESLHVYETRKPQRWFARHYDVFRQQDTWTAFSPSLHGARDTWRKATRPTALFLTTAAQLNAHQLLPLIHWFEHCLDIVMSIELLDPHRIAALITDNHYKRQILHLFKVVGLPVDDVRLTEQCRAILESRGTSSGSSARRILSTPLIEFSHAKAGEAPCWIPWKHEATGMQRLFSLFGHVLTAIQHGRFLVIDEFDVGLHPLVARYVVQLLNTQGPDSIRAQVLLTSHNTTLLDLELLRRDEIWLMQKDVTGTSQLSPLSRSRARKHELVGRSYLRGRYGAIPAIQSAFALAPFEEYDQQEYDD